MRTRVFTFWEPKGTVPPYIRLCMQTWPALGCEVTVLDYAQLADHLEAGALDLTALRQLPLPIQKDAVMVAVLRRHGGLFLDADTLAVGDATPILDHLHRAEVVMFESHVAVVGARPNARLLQDWYARIVRKLAAPPADGAIPWDHLGNSLLTAAMDDLIETHERKSFPVATADRALRLLQRWADGKGRRSRVVHGLLWRRKALYFRTVYRRYLASLDRNACGFMPERVHHADDGIDPRAAYERYWFESDARLESALLPNQTVIGLHHSFTPSWYAALSEDEVLAHPCLLSRTLRHLLRR